VTRAQAIAKVRKLLALARGKAQGGEHEAASAYAMAKKIIAKHKLDLPWIFNDGQASWTGSFKSWRRWRKSALLCKAKGCEEPVAVDGYCRLHHQENLETDRDRITSWRARLHTVGLCMRGCGRKAVIKRNGKPARLCAECRATKNELRRKKGGWRPTRILDLQPMARDPWEDRSR